MSYKRSDSGGSSSEEQKYVTRKNILRKLKRSKQKVDIASFVDNTYETKERRPSRDLVFCVTNKSTKVAPTKDGRMCTQSKQRDKTNRKYNPLDWESKTPFVFTMIDNATFPPIAEAEETDLSGDTNAENGE